MNEEILTRIAAALERIAPPRPESANPLAHPAYVWRGDTLTALVTVGNRRRLLAER